MMVSVIKVVSMVNTQGPSQKGDNRFLTNLITINLILGIISMALGIVNTGLIIRFSLENEFKTPRAELSVMADYKFFNVSKDDFYLHVSGVLFNEGERGTTIGTIEVMYYFPYEYTPYQSQFIISKTMPASMQGIDRTYLPKGEGTEFRILSRLCTYEIEHYNYTCRDVLEASIKYTHNDGLEDITYIEYFDQTYFYYHHGGVVDMINFL